MESMLSVRGKKLLIVNKYTFGKDKETKLGVSYKCTRRGCKATIGVDKSETVLLKSKSEHNHPPSDHLVKKVQNGGKRKSTEDICIEPRSKDVYQSKWFAFNHFDFLRDKDHPNDTLDSMEIQIKTEEDGDNDEKEESDYEPTLTDNANEFVVKETIETAPKRKVTEQTATRKRQKKSNDCTKLNEILKKTSAADSSSQDQSECQIFGNLVAKKLAKYSWELQSNVEQDIMNVLFKADRIHLNQTFNDLGISDHSTSGRSTPVTSLQHQLDVSDIELQDV